MVTVIPAREDYGKAAEGFGEGLWQGYANRSDESAIRRAIEKLPEKATPRELLNAITNTKTYSPESKQNALRNYLGVSRYEELEKQHRNQESIAKERNRINALKVGTKEQTEAEREALIDRGYTPKEALALTSPNIVPSVKSSISKNIEDEIARGLRQPGQAGQQAPAAPTPTQIEKSLPQEGVPPETTEAPADIVEAGNEQAKPTKPQALPPVTPEWPKLPSPKGQTHAEKDKWRAGNQKFNDKLLKDTKTKSAARKNSLLRYERLKTLNDSGKLPQGLGKIVINPWTGEPYGIASLSGKVNAETQDYVKTLADFLIDAKNYFGGRVTNFDVASFKARLPGLLNTESGRRIIIEQMKIMEQMQLAQESELESALKHYSNGEAGYSDIQRVVDERTVEKEGQGIIKMNSLDLGSQFLEMMLDNPAKYADYKMFQDPKDPKTFKAYAPNQYYIPRGKGWIEW
jgi:hypothetical protein